MPDIFTELQWRGLIHQTTDDEKLPGWLGEKPRSVYVGFDPTADSLHVGHLMGVMTLRRFQLAGHRPIALVGGATGMVGDPSGKSEERNLLSAEDLEANVAAVKEQLARFLDFECGQTSAELVNNYDWMGRFGYLEFLRDVGKHFPVNVMLTKDSVKSRLERTDSGLSYTEFSYMLLQAYDFVHLSEHFDCALQAGGSDQWGNITAGIDLARRMRSVQLHGMTCPLLTRSDGVKMGKSESGSVWLSPERTSPYAFYQYWMNVADEDAGKCLRFLTELDRDQIEALDQSRIDQPHKRESQKALAKALTQLVHDDEGLTTARRATEVFFGALIEDLNDAQLVEIFADVPRGELSRGQLSGDGLNLLDAFVEAGLAKSKNEARRVVQQGGGYVNNIRRDDIATQLTEADLASERVLVLRSVKIKFGLLWFV
jgi:tyrosyl-tRNA synthetase